MSKQAEEQDWDAPKTGGEFQDIERYRARNGFSDIVIVLSSCKKTPRHWTGKKFPNKKGFYLRCMEEGDGGMCCKVFGSPNPSNSAYILHLAERKGTNSWKIIGEPKAWTFSETTRLDKIGVIRRDHCEGDDKKFRSTKLIITCSDEKFQNVSIITYPGKEVKVTEDMKTRIKEMKDAFLKDVSIDAKKIEASIDRLREITDDTRVVEEQPDVTADDGEIDLEAELESIDEDLAEDGDGL